MPILFVFLDGIGLGLEDAAVNPFVRYDLPGFARLAGGPPLTTAAPVVDTPTHVFRPIDANLGVEGLPQSGTGQATLFTGVNGAALAGRHYGPFPHSKTRPVLATQSIFHQVQQLGLAADPPAAFANAYPPRFFKYVRTRDRWTVTTRCCMEADVYLRTHEDLKAGRALSADITGSGWPHHGDEITTLTPAAAAERLLSLSDAYPFTLYEYYMTDKVGHMQSFERAEPILHTLDAFFIGLLDQRRPGTTLVMTSDHGNLEDLSTKSHTRYPVPLVAYGPAAPFFRTAESLLDVTPAIIEALRAEAAAS